MPRASWIDRVRLGQVAQNHRCQVQAFGEPLKSPAGEESNMFSRWKGHTACYKESGFE